MKITTITIFFLVVGCMSIWRIIKNIKRNRFHIRSTFIWISLWLALIVGSIFPFILDYFMQFAQMQNRMFFILVAAVFVLFALMFDLNSKLEKTQQDNSKNVQEIAILKYIIHTQYEKEDNNKDIDNSPQKKKSDS